MNPSEAKPGQTDPPVQPAQPTSRRRGRRRRALVLFSLFLVAFIAFELGLQEEGPVDVTIQFLHYTSQRAARFQLINASPDPVTFVGHGQREPFYEISLHLENGWLPFSSDRVGRSAGFYTLRPGEGIEFDVPVINREAEWKLAVLCHRGAPRFLRLPSWLEWIPYQVYDRIRKRPRESSYIWSGTLPPLQPSRPHRKQQD